jgi:hypothetical protein
METEEHIFFVGTQFCVMVTTKTNHKIGLGWS